MNSVLNWDDDQGFIGRTLIVTINEYMGRYYPIYSNKYYDLIAKMDQRKHFKIMAEALQKCHEMTGTNFQLKIEMPAAEVSDRG